MAETKEMTQTKDLNNLEEILEKEPVVAPLISIYETEDDFVLTAEMPGVDKNDVKIKLEDENLVILGKVNTEEIRKRNYILKESNSGNYFRRVKLSESIDVDKISADFINGELTVHLPKHERVKPKTIEIK